MPTFRKKKDLKQPNFVPQNTLKITNPKIRSRKKTVKTRLEINEIETRETIQKINKTKGCFLKR